MGRRNNRKPYKIIGAYDSETTNYDMRGKHVAFPILHQLGLLYRDVTEVDSTNVKSACTVELYRHSVELFARLDELCETVRDFVPVICCHNLAFDMYGLSPWLDGRKVRVLAKSCRKPITFTILDDDNNARLVLWDTLVFSGQSLARMGRDCGYAKASGEWDYDKVRTPETPLTAAELDYAKRDVYALLVWLGWWIRRNPDIEPEKLGLNVVTKTGVVRERRKVRFYNLKGNGRNRSVGEWWYLLNQRQAPRTDDELFTMIACTRGGFTFCASRSASVPYDCTGSDYRVFGFDATSQHPAQMVSHRYPIGFHETSCKALELVYQTIARRDVKYVLDNWSKPFSSGVLACYEFENLRPKAGTLFERFGIYPFASARFKAVKTFELNEDNQDSQEFAVYAQSVGYADTAVNPTFAFGKLVRADKCRLFLTELSIWELSRAYEYDSMRAIGGYVAGRFTRPTDMAVISVMQFYKAKNEFKKARERYFDGQSIDNGHVLESLGIPHSIVSSMENGTLSENEVDLTYLALKADLNALFGIEASNEYRRDTVLTSEGIGYTGEFGICNAPRNKKAWYQFGQRIVGWSRIAQICVLELAAPYIEAIVNGDTDSCKFYARRDALPDIQRALSRYARAIDSAKGDNCARVKTALPSMYDQLDGIGHYVLEFESERFCASWNKAYCTHDVNPRTSKHEFSFTLAGIPTRTVQIGDRTHYGLNAYADNLHAGGKSFADVCNLLLGYNVTIAPDITRLNARKFPEWAELLTLDVTDYMGRKSHVVEPCALALYPMAKTINDTDNKENAANMRVALRNNPNVNVKPKIVHSEGVLSFDD